MTRAYLVIFPIVTDGTPDLDARMFAGTYEETADPIVAFVDGRVNRGVDGMALEAWLITGEVGTAHPINDADDPALLVCTIVRLAVPS